ncbi:MAG: pyridoxal phosphate-dependent aminotransferase [Acidobacteria bacterium]|nr:pyridoxal phosphate-dependent aminotransferase [Acidobacteriota bacterium]
MTASRNIELADRLSKMTSSSTLRVLQMTERLRAEGIDVISLGAGEPDFPTPENIREAAITAIGAGFTKYTAAGGIADLRRAIIERMRRDFDADFGMEEVIATVGGKQAIFEAIAAIVNPGDEVLIPSPYWVTFPEVVHFCGGTPVFIDTEPEDFQLTAEAVRERLTPRTRLLVLNSPNNPTGRVVPPEEVRRIVELAAERDFRVLIDDCYLYFVYPPVEPFSAAGLPPELASRCMVTGSFSKTYAMTGWRIGYALGPAEWIKAMVTIQSHSTSNPTSISQYAAIEAFAGRQDSVREMLDEYRRRRDWLVAALNEIPGVKCLLPEGAFYAFPNIRGLLSGDLPTSRALADALLEHAGVAVTSGSAFGAEGYIRLSYATGLDDLQRAVERIRAYLDRR